MPNKNAAGLRDPAAKPHTSDSEPQQLVVPKVEDHIPDSADAPFNEQITAKLPILF